MASGNCAARLPQLDNAIAHGATPDVPILAEVSFLFASSAAIVIAYGAGFYIDDVTKLIAANPAALVLLLGDNAYNDGETGEYDKFFKPVWGVEAIASRVWPRPGNHDYHTRNATPYFAHFKEKAGPADRRGFHSFDWNSWHIVSLNTERDDAISLSVALNRPDRSFGAIMASRASSLTEGSARVYISDVTGTVGRPVRRRFFQSRTTESCGGARPNGLSLQMKFPEAQSSCGVACRDDGFGEDGAGPTHRGGG